MNDSSLRTLLSTNRPASRTPTGVPTPRRTTHGSGVWLTPSADAALRQPQDGSLTHPAAHMSRIVGLLSPAKQLLESLEGEDAKLSGTTRSLARRLLGLNVAKAKSPKANMGEVATFQQPESYFSEARLAPLASSKGSNANKQVA